MNSNHNNSNRSPDELRLWVAMPVVLCCIFMLALLVGYGLDCFGPTDACRIVERIGARYGRRDQPFEVNPAAACQKCLDPWRYGGSVPCEVALRYGDYMALKALIAAGADPEAQIAGCPKVIRGTSPLMVLGRAVPGGDEEKCAELLLNRGARLEDRNRRQQTALHIASLHGNSTMVKWLIMRNAKIDVTDCEGNTPLHLAAMRSSLINKAEYTTEAMIAATFNTTRLLLEANADITVENDEGETACDIWPEVIEMY